MAATMPPATMAVAGYLCRELAETRTPARDRGRCPDSSGRSDRSASPQQPEVTEAREQQPDDGGPRYGSTASALDAATPLAVALISTIVLVATGAVVTWKAPV